MPTPENITKPDAIRLLREIEHFMPKAQYQLLRHDLFNSEESQAFFEIVLRLHTTIARMPIIRGTEYTKDPTAHLHYLTPYANADWWIIEKDTSTESQRQAFGLARIHCAELGYIPICELIEIPDVELDFHWKPKPLSAIRRHIKGEPEPTPAPPAPTPYGIPQDIIDMLES